MIKNVVFFGMMGLLAVGCYQPERNCTDFKNGKFSFIDVVDGKELKTTFVRADDLEVDYFEGKVDSSSVRWINDCEYIVKKLHPNNRAEEKPIHMKILSTTDISYTFEYGIVGEAKKQKGTVIKTK